MVSSVCAEGARTSKHVGEHVNEQVRNTFDRHPAYDTGASQEPESETNQPSKKAGKKTSKRASTPFDAPDGFAPRPEPISANARGRAAALLSILGVLLALVTLGGGYAVLRWAESPAAWFVTVISAGLLVLSALALAAGRVGGLATFVVIALLLPFATALTTLSAIGQRVEDGFGDLFSSDDSATAGEAADAEEEPSPAEQAVALGEAGQANEFAVTVSGLECSGTLKRAGANPKFGEDEDAPEFVNVKAPEGKQFCVVTSVWSNDSQAPGSVSGWNSFSGLVAADGTKFSALTEDSDLSTRLTDQAGYDGGVLNPGDRAEVRSVFTVAEGQEFTHAVVEQFDLETPEVWFSLS